MLWSNWVSERGGNGCCCGGIERGKPFAGTLGRESKGIFQDKGCPGRRDPSPGGSFFPGSGVVRKEIKAWRKTPLLLLLLPHMAERSRFRVWQGMAIPLGCHC